MSEEKSKYEIDKDFKRLQEIGNFIVEKYPNSCLSQNVTTYGNAWMFKDKDELLDNVLGFFNYDVVGLCGCGCPEYTWEVIRIVLEIQNDYHNRDLDLSWLEIKSRYKNELNIDTCNDIQDGILQFILYILNDKNILEHGSSVGGSWLTDLGKMYLEVLNIWRRQEASECEICE